MRDLESEFDAMIVAMYGGRDCISEVQYREQKRAFMGGALTATVEISMNGKSAASMLEQFERWRKTANAEARADNFQNQ